MVSEEELRDNLCTVRCIISSDRSAPVPKGSFAWIISDEVGTEWLDVQDQHLDATSAPTEQRGMASCQDSGFSSGSFKFTQQTITVEHTCICDNDSMVQVYRST